MLNITGTIKLNKKTLKIEGTIYDPLFNAKRVLIDILGFPCLDACSFYNERQNNDKYVIKDQDQLIYLTEFALFGCIHESNKSISNKTNIYLKIQQCLRKIASDFSDKLKQEQLKQQIMIQEQNEKIKEQIIIQQNLKQEYREQLLRLDKMKLKQLIQQ